MSGAAACRCAGATFSFGRGHLPAASSNTPVLVGIWMLFVQLVKSSRPAHSNSQRVK